MFNRPIFLTVCNGAGRLVNFFLYLLIANFYGASRETDWFFFVYAVAYFFIGVCYYATESALVPAWHQMPENDHSPMFRSAVCLAFYALPVMSFFLLVSGFVVAPQRGIILPDSRMMALAACVVLALQPSLAFLSSLFSSYRQYRRQYLLPTVHLTLRTAGVLAVLLLARQRTILVLALAYLAGELLRLLGLQFGQPWRQKAGELAAPASKSFWSVYGPVAWMTLALMCTVINPVIDLAMVGKFRGGSVTLVEYAGRLRGMPVLALGGLLIYFLGEWSHQHHQQGGRLPWRQVRSTVVKLVLFCVPVVALLMAMEKTWVPLVFFSGKFGQEDLHQLQRLLYCYFPGVPFLAGSMVLSRALLVVQKARLVAFVTLVAAAGNIIFNLGFMRLLGLPGVALSTTLVDVFVCGMYFFLARRLLPMEPAG